MQREDGTDGRAEDAAWREIVENYGERATLDPTEDLPARSADQTPQPERSGDHPSAPPRDETRADDDETARGPAEEPQEDREDRFVPPEPPPVPIPSPDRLAAWVGVLGSPATLLVCLIAGIAIPTWLGWLMVAGFIGGFCYLVLKMPGSPRDPWDDGAQV
ncbi:hypothetical protein E8D34_03095 [Nocardioides sp. GY 10113]|uniref:hypothetical protein n=1 Tax=Nocardioides sp. GY 10113 TaxID=2569761 RepID=UPI0010A813D3|nr:hypothetical protein [Nocardioides sp. GY 10113]TIC88675.1 hypothetical protein E8D34_03095 [Nocardioides sp. GY 10113]